jgi:hypothetical protein
MLFCLPRHVSIFVASQSDRQPGSQPACQPASQPAGCFLVAFWLLLVAFGCCWLLLVDFECFCYLLTVYADLLSDKD